MQALRRIRAFFVLAMSAGFAASCSDNGGTASTSGTPPGTSSGGTAGAGGVGGDSGGAGATGGGGESGGAGGGGGGSMSCMDGAFTCGDEGVERCDAGVWKPFTPCPQGCAAGACASAAVTCKPGERLCYASSVKECNLAGTAWVHAELCLEGCSGGQCAGACAPGSYRCNGDKREVCDPGGSSWSTSETCLLGCDHAVCVEKELTNQGNVISIEGTHVYKDCVSLTLGAALNVPAGKKAEIWARCMTMAPATTATLGAGSSLVVHASETIDLQGSVSGGSLAYFSALDSLTNGGSLQSGAAVLRANKLTNTASGDTGANAVALYGEEWTNAGAHTGQVSVMPPELLSSVSHPEGGTWNITANGLDISWDRPFPSALGYYILAGEDLPSPANAMLVTEEKATIAGSALREGVARVRVVGVNADGVIGTVTEDLYVDLNVRPPIVSSSSHPDEGTWSDVDDVFLSWTDPASMPPSSILGYTYVWDHQANTVPGASAKVTTDKQALLVGQPPGIWFFHIASLDRLGRPSPLVAHYEVRIGSKPEDGNIAGTITAQNGGAPIAGATVLLNGGLFRTVSLSTGDYTFSGQVPALSEPYTLKVLAPGHAPAEDQIAVAAGNTVVKSYALAADPSLKAYRLGWEFKIHDQSASNPMLALGPRGKLIWSTFTNELVLIGRGTGQTLTSDSTGIEYYSWGAPTEVGWSGDSFFAIDYYKCDDNGSFLPGHGWSCLQMKTWDANGQAKDGWTPYGQSGHSGSPSAAWNGSSYGTFFVSYTAIYFRELTSSLGFANSGGPTDNSLLAGGYPDLRQSGRTRALWDGSNYAVLYQMENIYFARYDAALSAVTAPVNLDKSGAETQLGLVYDGSLYHAAYIWDDANNKDAVALRSIDPAGQVSARTIVADDVTGSMSEPALAYDQRKLLVAYSKGGEGVLEVRSPKTHALEQTVKLGPALNPRVAFSKETGESYLLYVRPGVTGTFLRQLFTDPG